MIKTFRGLLADDGQDRIRLSTIKGKVGYRIAKFQLMGPDESETAEASVKIYKTKQSTINGTIDFTDGELLAAAIYQQNATGQSYPIDLIVIFDNEIFNQDIYITQKGGAASALINYYLELEVVPLDEKAAEYTTVKDLRTRGF